MIPKSGHRFSEKIMLHQETHSVMTVRRKVITLWVGMRFLVLILALLTLPARAQDYPVRPVELVVPFAAGGGTDLIARVLAERLSESLKQRFVIINRPGASTNIGTAAVANAPADGYTLLITSISLAANSSLYRKLSYDAQRDFAPITLIANSPSILVVTPALPVKTAPELIAHLKARPGELNYASYGAGSGPHLATGLLQDITGTRMQHVPYGGGAPATMAVLRGEVQMLLAGSLAVGPMIQSGQLKPLAIAAEARSPVLPNIPTFREQGIDYVTGTWFGLPAPARTPPAIVALLSREVQAALRVDAVRARFAEQGADVVGGSPEAFAQFLKAETDRLAAVIRSAKIQLD
jgi:tripartite-type tricarboxylate transporter receptor subunit TctC